MSATGGGGGRVARPVAALSLEEIDGRLAVYVPRAERICYLNETAARTWLLCDGRRTDRDVAAMIAEAYGQQVEVVEPLVLRVLDSLRAAGVLEDPAAG
jgi:hypothetical protein